MVDKLKEESENDSDDENNTQQSALRNQKNQS
jgi:hypothetical protein